MVRLGRVGARPRVRSHRQGRAVQPRRLGEGPARDRHDRRRRARGPAAAGRHDRRADVGQHRRRPRHRGRAPRLPLHLRDVRQDERREGRAAARVRRRGGGVPDRGAARAPRLLLLRRPTGSPARRRARSGPTSTRTRTTRPSTSAPPDPRSGARPTAASPTSWPASAPAAPSPASPATSRSRTRPSRSSAPTPRARCTRGGTGRPYLVEGVGEDFWPTTYDPALVDRVIKVTDAESFAAARRVTREEGLLIGGSGGTAVHAALVVGRDLGPDASSWCCCPTPGAATCRRSSTTSG